MIDIQTQRRIKINLADYDNQRDIENRLLMARFTHADVTILQELLFSSLKLPLRKLVDAVDFSEEVVLESLEKLSKTGLLAFDKETVTVDKEMRKYYEAQAQKFEEDFEPGMEFLLSLVRKVPIHVLPAWYAIPRTSNNIIESIIEKYLHTPAVFHRYLQEFFGYYPHLAPLIKDLYASDELKMRAQDVLKEYELDREQFEETMLLLEFSMIAVLRYERENEEWQEVITPFEEWRDYLAFQRDTQAESIKDEEEISAFRTAEFAFVQDMAQILKAAKRQPLPESILDDAWLQPKSGKKETRPKPLMTGYAKRLLDKIKLLKLAELDKNGNLLLTESGKEWLTYDDEEQALYLYRHTQNHIVSDKLSQRQPIDRNVREAEKSIQRILLAGWVYFDDFAKGVLISFNEDAPVTLKKAGRTWKYALPEYTPEQANLVRATVMDWLFEVGVVAIGHHRGRECFKVTSFGQTLFGR